MSHYAVNASVPKTLIQHVIRWVAQTGRLGPDAAGVLERVLATEISPELVPGDAREQPHQGTEAFIGPYELQDFNLYYITRFGMRPSKVAFLSWHAWRDARAGLWPVLVAEGERRQYTLAEIRQWLEVFLHRFFQTSQFKRSALPNSPKVVGGGSLSPRGDWRAPSDSSSKLWLAELRENVPEA
jgi:NAD+ synthase (glutamine-hydrolysing)